MKHRRSAGRLRNSLLTAWVCGLAGCMLLPSPTENPGPTQLLPRGAYGLEVAWDNRADSPYVITVAEDATLRAVAEVEPCVTGNLTMTIDLPFAVGLGAGSDAADVSRPAPMIVDSNTLDDKDEYRLMVRIAADGSVAVEPLAGIVEPSQREDC